MIFLLNFLFSIGSDVVQLCKQHPSLILANPHYCQQYYNCSMKEYEDLTRRFRVRRMHLTECDYPFLFSTDTLQCEIFTEVKCGHRYEIKYKCKLMCKHCLIQNYK